MAEPLPNDWVVPQESAPAATATGEHPNDWVTPPADADLTVKDALMSLLVGGTRGALTVPGIAGDVANLAQLGVGKLTGNEDWKQQARAGLAGENGFDMGTRSIEKLLDRIGINYQPTSHTGQSLYDVAHFAGAVPAMAASGGVGPALARGLGTAVREGVAPAIEAGIGGISREGVADAAAAAGKGLVQGTGAGIGLEAANAGLDKISGGHPEDISPWVRVPAQMGAAVLGGGAAGGALSRIDSLIDRPDIIQDMKTAGVTPGVPTDIGQKSGFWNWNADSFGARGISQRTAQNTQDQIGDYVKGTLGADKSIIGPNLRSSIGSDIGDAASEAQEKLRGETRAAYTALDTAVADVSKDAPFEITPTASSQLAKDAVQSSKPEVQAALDNPVLQQFGPALRQPTLSWQEMDAMRQKVGAMIGHPPSNFSGDEVGLLSQLYKSLTEDMQAGASQHPAVLEAFNKAIATARENGGIIDDLEANVTKSATPEKAADWLLGESKLGPNRLASLLGRLPDDTAQNLSQRLLAMSGNNPQGQFDLNHFMNFWKTRDPFAQGVLAPDGSAMRDQLDRAGRLYDATAQSRSLIPKYPNAPTSMGQAAAGAVTVGAPMIAGLTHAVGSGDLHGLVTGGLTAAAGTAVPAANAGLAMLGQRSGALGRTLLPGWGAAPGIGNVVKSTPGQIIPDYFTPPQRQSQVTPTGDAQTWLAQADRPTATAYVQQRLGPQVASQLPADDLGFKAALSNLWSDPGYRKALTSAQVPS
jgi:hypothetical protein